jgi:hypothetical protein
MRHIQRSRLPIPKEHRMNTLSVAKLPPTSPDPRPVERSPMRQAFKDLSQALSSEDLGAARKAYVAVVKAAPEGAQWKPESAFAEVGRQLTQGNLPAAAEAAKAAAAELRGRIESRRPPTGPVVPPVEDVPAPLAGPGSSVGRSINLVA